MADDKADISNDDFNERVTRNEGRLVGLEDLVRETRESDRKLIEQRSESLARELERRAEALLELVTARADAVLAIGKEERESDRREVELLITELEKRTVVLREVYDTAIQRNFEESREAIIALEARRVAATDRIEQMVRQWRESDERARELFSADTVRRLDELNHNNERVREILGTSVPRELWQSEKDATLTRESEIRTQIATAINAASEVLNNKVDVVTDKVAELKSHRDVTSGRSSGYTQFYGWLVGALALVVSVVVAANALSSR